MRVVDTSAWIEMLIRSPLALSLFKEVPPRNECVVPTIVQLELAKWLNREGGPAKADLFLSFTLKCRVVGLETDLALEAATLSAKHKLSTADAIIYATALEQKAELLTCDAHFKELPFVFHVPKRVN